MKNDENIQKEVNEMLFKKNHFNNSLNKKARTSREILSESLQRFDLEKNESNSPKGLLNVNQSHFESHLSDDNDIEVDNFALEENGKNIEMESKKNKENEVKPFRVFIPNKKHQTIMKKVKRFL